MWCQVVSSLHSLGVPDDSGAQDQEVLLAFRAGCKDGESCDAQRIHKYRRAALRHFYADASLAEIENTIESQPFCGSQTRVQVILQSSQQVR